MSKAQRDQLDAEVNTDGASGAGRGDSPPPGTCSATTQYGRPCQNPAPPGKDVCWSHAPENAAQRAKNARAGGRAAHSPGTAEIAELKDELKALVRDVKGGVVPPGVGAVLNQLLNSMLRAVETERKVRETEDLEERLAALEGRGDGPSAREAA